MNHSILLYLCRMIPLLAKVFGFPYSGVLWLRHVCYDYGLIRSIRPVVPTLSIGNITVGGTGKTPHTELVLTLFSQDMPVAVLSRGYRRRSKGFRYVSADDCVADVGDEPLQIKRKFPNVVVAVDRNRIAGIQRIYQDYPQTRLVVLDDAFQYRKLIPSVSMLLSPYSLPFTRDALWPFGRLRDLPTQAKRAQVMVVSKTPSMVSTEEREYQIQLLKPNKNQCLLFSHYSYGAPCALFPHNKLLHSPSHPPDQVLAITGIARPESFLAQIRKRAKVLEYLKFPDHHVFTKKDALRINAIQAKHPDVAIYTTEKDAMRLLETSGLSPQVCAALHYIPIRAEFCSIEECRQFMELIMGKCVQSSFTFVQLSNH